MQYLCARKHQMRLWSIHPQYLDSKGLVALWREALLAKHVLEGKTKGYKNHPQLIRFKTLENPVLAVSQYLAEVLKEAQNRNYNFDKNKIETDYFPVTLLVTQGQINYEFRHLLKKLIVRDPAHYQMLISKKKLHPHPMFIVTKGSIEPWEVLG